MKHTKKSLDKQCDIPKPLADWRDKKWPIIDHYTSDIQHPTQVAVSNGNRAKRIGATAAIEHLMGVVDMLIHLNNNLDLRSLAPDEVVNELEQELTAIGLGGDE